MRINRRNRLINLNKKLRGLKRQKKVIDALQDDILIAEGQWRSRTTGEFVPRDTIRCRGRQLQELTRQIGDTQDRINRMRAR